MAKQTPAFEEEDLDLVVVDAEMIKTIVRTQGQIIALLNSMNIAILGLTANIGLSNNITQDLNDSIGRLCDTNLRLTDFLNGETMARLGKRK